MYEWLSEPYFSDEEDVLYAATDGLQASLSSYTAVAYEDDGITSVDLATYERLREWRNDYEIQKETCGNRSVQI